MEDKKRLVLIDSSSIFYRSFYAVKPLFTQEGVQVNAVFGFLSIFLNIIEKLNPDFFIAAFDERGKTFRHEEYKEYKANRKKAPDELYEQIPLIKEFLSKANIKMLSKQGFEADDVLGTIAEKIQKLEKEIETIIFTSDRDMLQLITKNVFVAFPAKYGNIEIFDEEKMISKYDISANQVVDLKALAGDKSDNIPGIFGVGEKTAKNLLEKYENLENIFKNIKNEKPQLQKKFESGKEDAIISQKLAKIKTDVDLKFSLEEIKFEKLNLDTIKIKNFLIEINAKTIIKRINKITTKKEGMLF